MKKIRQTVLDCIVADACELFLSRSVESVTVKDIADKSGVGVATVYRYFSTKRNIVENCAVRLQTKVFEEYFKLTGKNGYEKIEKFYLGYLEIFKKHPEFYKFINEFDAYILSEGGVNLTEYAEGLDLFADAFFKAYNDGVKDGSISEKEDVTAFYYGTTHAMLELCKKLSANIRIVKQDGAVEKDAEIKAVIGVFLAALKAREN